jgi:hypothetical protein
VGKYNLKSPAPIVIAVTLLPVITDLAGTLGEPHNLMQLKIFVEYIVAGKDLCIHPQNPAVKPNLASTDEQKFSL